ncbi:EscU/YscU/HrcU family type III secretion system export apparatus switch protein [Chitinibacter bivalviorum]|uniref:EscU/YscU/HrcU family type III secretion system export apparatus switch protein n=1 Tax=Chitinibacter bivalviorum TaxID=2739434 RepID=A0A7H9BIM5_9NEIS|nr:EscU/YscU/HrcU family type III secretion system export apparatus switch protein [Chitinibacter bivalviorum]QLG87404.1 EscU/YscU/HrcU family type III secretion system export apparatus switch protein [Chitinibacter bivalviorum]
MNIKPKRAQAIALAYREGSAAPRVVAKGKGQMAERIIEKAKEAGIFVHDSPEMVALLMQVDLDSQIPPQLYRAVAELLAFIYMLERGDEITAPDFSYLSEQLDQLPAADTPDSL